MILDNPCNIQFCNANLLEINASVIASSEASGYEITKALNYQRQTYWKPTGRFLIDSSNQVIYINDGSNKQVNIPANDYTTGTLLATTIQTALNSISSGFTVSYSSNTFSITNSSAFTLRLSQQTNAIFYTIGFSSIIDQLNVSHVATEKRCHYPYEEIQIDFLFNANIDFFAMIGKINEEFQISNNATITILANNLNDFSAPPLSVIATVNDEGAFYSFNEIDSSYRFWRVRIKDFENQLGSGFEISNLYLGQAVFFEYRNASNGFEFVLNDNTVESESESGVKYFDEGQQYYTFDGLNFAILDQTNKDIMIKLFQDQGKSRPFYLCLDPLVKITSEISRFNRLVRFSDAPRFQHIFYKYYSVRANMVEHF